MTKGKAKKTYKKQVEESDADVEEDLPPRRTRNERSIDSEKGLQNQRGVMSQYQVSPPDKFDFSNPALWPRWIKKFERFRLASELYLKPDRQQISMLLYSLGEEGEDLFETFGLGDEDGLEFEEVVKSFENFLGLKKNIVYERAKFLKRRQEPGEPVDSFINDLHKLAESCEFSQLKESLVRDLIVIGVSNPKLSETLQMDESLTLHKAIAKARQAEAIARQQAVIREAPLDTVGAVQGKLGSKTFKCRRCSLVHGPKECPAFNEKCRKCGIVGHYARVCPKKFDVKEVEANSEKDGQQYLGEVASAVEFRQCPTVSVRINGQNLNFKMDTGADVSVMGVRDAQALRLKIQPTERVLFGPGRTKLRVEGVAKALVEYKDKVLKEDIYILASQNSPLLSRTALLSLELLTFNVSLVDGESWEKRYPDVFKGMGKLDHPYTIILQENARPYAVLAPRRVAISLHDSVREELRRMVEEGVIEPIIEPTDWCSPIVVVPRKGGRIRLCVDYTKLNQFIKREQLQLPSVEESLAKVEGGKFFSKVDAANGFWQVPLNETSYKLTTFITPFGRYFYKRLPFGICSGPEVFQKRISQILSDIPGVVNQADDILISGTSESEHDERLDQVMKRLSENGITLNRNKCEFGSKSVIFLGHLISEAGISPDPTKTKSVADMRAPVNVSEVRQFLGMINQLMKFVPNLVEITAPLRCLLKKGTAWTWEDAQVQAFEKLKNAATKAPILAKYRRDAEVRITADASSYGLGGVVEQREGDCWHPLAYASKSMSDTESRYAQIEKEALSLTWACEKFSSYILGRQFLLYTDHKPLVEILGSKPIADLSARLQRFRMRLQIFDYKVVYLPGKENVIADCLSRNSADVEEVSEANVEPEFDEDLFIRSILEVLPCSDRRLQEIKNAQEVDPECQELKRAMSENEWRKNWIYWKYRNELVVEAGLVMRGRRLFIPRSMRREILAKIHEGHLGIVKCRRRAQESVWWPGCSTSVKEVVDNCLICLEHRQNRKEPLISTELPLEPWSFLGADMMKCNQNWYLVLQDYYSRFIEVVQVGTLSSESIIGKMKNIFARHGIPLKIRTDGGTQFTSEQFMKFAKEFGFQPTTSSPNFPQSNGEAENAVAIAKRIILKNKDPNLGLLAYRTTKLESGLSPAELLYGRKLRSTLPSGSNYERVKEEDLLKFKGKDQILKSRMKNNFDNRRGVRDLPELKEDDEVWLKDLKRTGRIISKAEFPRSYRIRLPSGTEVRRNRWHLVLRPKGIEEERQLNGTGGADNIPNENTRNGSTANRRSERTLKKPARYM